MKRCVVALAAALLTAYLGVATALGSTERETLWKQGVEALARGAHDEAIDQFELLADRGHAHPDVSFNRAAAYVARARSAAARPGDLGRAAAALVETLHHDSSDEEAARALETVRREIARRRARRGAAAIAERPALGRAVLGLFPENGWALAAALGSLLSTVGLALGLFASHRRPRLTGAILTGAGTLLLLVGGSAAVGARQLRLTSSEGVVVVPEARLLDEQGRPLPPRGQEPNEIPEGASVFVRQRGGQYWQVEWGTVDGWVAAGQVRLAERR